jgi:hypothetical protein
LARPKGAIGRHHPPNQEFNMLDEKEMARIRKLELLCDECGEFYAVIECEDITGYSRRPCDYLCARCYGKRCDYGDDGREWPQARNE